LFARCSYFKLSTLHRLIFPIIFLCVITLSYGQANDTLIIQANGTDAQLLLHDTLAISKPDTLRTQVRSSTMLETKVERSALDSIRHDMRNRMIYLYGDASIVYGDITLKAAVIEVDFQKNEVFAYGVVDSTGKLIGTPVFTESGQTFEAETITYNFDSRKGLIYSVFTEDGQGYLHGERVKKMNDNTINIQSGSYTTCNNRTHPHFEFRFNKSKVIPNNKIITGPAFMAIEGVPTPLAVPFGMFPNKTGQRSGIRVPTYGESTGQFPRGFYFENGGYYWAINENMDLDLLGDIYTRGSWAIKPTFRYVKRYKYSGNLNTSYAINVLGSAGAPDYERRRDFQVRWTHRQDPKARPASQFTANVFVVSGNFTRFNPVSTQDYLSNEFQSSIAYQTNWNNKYMLTLNASHRQNTKTKIVQISLPEITFSRAQFYPLRRKNPVGRPKWYENLNVSYRMNARNTISLPDSLLFKPDALHKMQNGIDQVVPINLPIKFLKHFTLTNSANIRNRTYFDSRRKYWSNDTIFRNNDTIVGYVVTDTVRGFNNVLDFSLSSSLTTKVYGMVNFRRGPVRAIRHVITPNVGLSYSPEFGNPSWGYYDRYLDADSNEVVYSRFEGSIYGFPQQNKSGRLNFGFTNNFEIKVPSRRDTITGLRKVVLIESLSLTGSYDLARDSLNFSDIVLSGRTRLFKNLNVQYGSSWSLYAADSVGRDFNAFQWDIDRKLLRPKRTSWNFSLNWNLRQQDFARKRETTTTTVERTSEFGSEDELREINQNPDDYIDWAVPWSLNINYTFQYINTLRYPEFMRQDNRDIVQTLGFSGEVNITPKWKISVRSGWDFKTNDITYTQINIYRDLHCWEMRFSWIPSGFRQSWNFSINVKASVLQDLKLNKKKDFRDI
jgi:lipopolysaccharide assembly outer membrane protein LptD (OstA)